MLLLFFYCAWLFGVKETAGWLVGWLVGKGHARSGEGRERQGEIGGKDGKILGKLGGSFSRRLSWCMRRRRKIAKSFGSGACFLFVETRHAPVI